jgi:hypothetical protein
VTINTVIKIEKCILSYRNDSVWDNSENTDVNNGFWVVIFGFPPSHLSQVLAIFTQVSDFDSVHQGLASCRKASLIGQLRAYKKGVVFAYLEYYSHSSG